MVCAPPLAAEGDAGGGCDGEADGVGVNGGSVKEGVADSDGDGLLVSDGVLLGLSDALGDGDGVALWHALALPSDASADEQSGSEPDTGVKALGLGRVLTNGTAIAAPVLVPKTWFMPCSVGSVPLVCPAHVATTQSGEYVMYHASTKLSVVPDLPAVSYLKCRPHCLA